MANNPRIVVIGAGIAGLAAASTLIEAGFNNITILEAESRIGGRVYSLEKDGCIFELGAGWLHYTDTELFQLCRECNFVAAAAANDDDFIMSSAILHDDIDKRPLDAHRTAILNENLAIVELLLPSSASTNATAAPENAAPESLGDILSKNYAEIRQSSDDAETRSLKLSSLDLGARILLDDFGACSLYDISVSGHAEEECGTGAYMTRLNVPLSQLIQRVCRNVPDSMVRLNCRVGKISFSHQSSDAAAAVAPVQVIYTDSMRQSEQRLDADHVVLTVSVGVLKAEYKKLFSPQPLSPTKQLVIESFGMGYLGTLFFNFPEELQKEKSKQTWWQAYWCRWQHQQQHLSRAEQPPASFVMHMIYRNPESLRDGFRVLLDKRDNSGEQFVINWTRFISGLYFFPVLKQQTKVGTEGNAKEMFDYSWCRVLLPGCVAYHVDSLDDNVVICDFSNFVRKLMDDDTISEAVQLVRYRWGVAENFRGSFSYPSMACATNFGGSSGSSVLSEPEWFYSNNAHDSSEEEKIPALLFAGEATAIGTGVGYLHGAYDSGKREARRLIQIYRRKNDEALPNN